MNRKATITTFIVTLFLTMSPTYAQDDKVMLLGKETFAACSLCHGPDGKGAKAGDIVMAPNLHESAFVKSKAEPLIAVILKGIHKEDNKYLQMMVPLEEGLSDEQIAAVSTYVRSEFGGRKNVIEPEFVKKVRAEHQSRTMPWNRAELAQLVARLEAGPLISNLGYSIYEGKWEELPDFSTMKPDHRGTIQNNLVTLNVVENKQRAFGAVFEGNLTLKHSDDYEFSLWAMDGGALIIDGENVLLTGGDTATDVVKAVEKLEAGEHTFKVHYLYNGSKPRLALAMTSTTLGDITLSTQAMKSSGKKNDSHPPIVLTPENGEAIVHRAFLPDEKPRAIAVGYPGGISLSWNADTLNLAHLWRGGFLDVAPHWNERGSGSQPIGEAQLAPAMGMPFQVLANLEAPWVAFSEATIKYERDTANPQKEMTFNIDHPDYQYVGYRLNDKRFPTFIYTYRNLEITDRFTPAQLDGQDAIVRTLTLKGQPDANLYFRVCDQSSDKADPKESGWITMENLAIQLEGAEPIFRQSDGRNEVLARISEPAEIKLTYRWLEPRKPAKASD